jgi:acyl-CoA synthetase (AMP-forming)/AMP-acid ligase II
MCGTLVAQPMPGSHDMVFIENGFPSDGGRNGIVRIDPDGELVALLERGSGDFGQIHHDLTAIDDERVLFLRGRRNELILRGGANVYPAEVERVLLEHDDVAEAAVMGVADRRLGERVVAAVVLRDDASADEAALRDHCRRLLARYKVPETIAIVETLPRNAMSKVVKRELRTLFT